MSESEEWNWELTDTARSQLDDLAPENRERIVRKLDDVVTSSWRDPADSLEPLSRVAYQKLRIGPFRLGCRLDRQARILWVLRIRKRGGDAYRDDD